MLTFLYLYIEGRNPAGLAIRKVILLGSFPDDLKFYFLAILASLMLDIDDRIFRNSDPFVRDLNRKLFAFFQAVR